MDALTPRDVSTHAGAYLKSLADTVKRIDSEALADVVAVLWEAWQTDQVVFTCGNGGSASTASHMAVDLTKETMVAGSRALRVMALTDNNAVISAWANDSDYSRVFAEQLRVHGRPGDVLVCISVSGASPNVLEAITEAHDIGITVVGLGGSSGGPLSQRSDVYLHVPDNDYGVVESAHLAIDHCLAAMLQMVIKGERKELDVDDDLPVVIVDRDGVINRNLDRGVLTWSDFEFLPGALQGLATLTLAGHRVVLITNQANIGRGVLTRARLNEIHRQMETAVIAAGGLIEAIYICEHRPEDGCGCRKPAPGLLRRAAEDGGFDLRGAYVIGDHRTDVAAARAAGAQSVLVLSGRERDVDDIPASEQPDLIVDDLAEAAQLLVERHRVAGAAAGGVGMAG